MKNKLRSQLITLRKECNLMLSEAYFPQLLKNFFEFLRVMNIQRALRNIAGFHPLVDEINILYILQRAFDMGYIICLPKVIEQDSMLLFKRWDMEDTLEYNRFNILEPLSDAQTVTPDCIIVPLLGFDRRGFRIGYGKGYYDRTLPQFPHAIKIGVCYSFQEVKRIPEEGHDYPLDYIITEKEIINSGKQSI